MFEPLTASLLPDPAVSPLERFRAEGAAVLAGGHTTIRSRSLTVLRVIDTLIRTRGQSPTVREIMQACGYQSTGSVAYQRFAGEFLARAGATRHLELQS